MDTDIVIIGGGAAGLMAAIGARHSEEARSADHSPRHSEEHEVRRGNLLVLEKMPRPARKVMITGKGRCNFTNLKEWNEFSQHVHPKPNLLRPAFMNFPPSKIIGFLEDCGLRTVVERGDRAYPASYRASDVVDTLERAARRADAEILCGKEVCNVEVHEGHDGETASENFRRFSISCSDGSVYHCHKLIIATGGLSYPSTGSTGDGLKWASRLGISVAPTHPSLTAIVPAGYKTQDRNMASFEMKGHINRSTPLSDAGKLLCGQSLENVGIALTIDGNVVQEEFGDLDFTDGGLEGPLGFHVSRKCVRAMTNGSKASVTIDLKPAVELHTLQTRIARLWKEIGSDSRSRGASEQTRFNVLLGKLLPRDFIPGFLRWSPRLDEGNLARRLKTWNLDIAGFVGYERCVVTAGGVLAEEISPKTMESKRIPGLYFAGEVLDLDADTGGYNLQIAFSTGFLAGKSASSAL